MVVFLKKILITLFLMGLFFMGLLLRPKTTCRCLEQRERERAVTRTQDDYGGRMAASAVSHLVPLQPLCQVLTNLTFGFLSARAKNTPPHAHAVHSVARLALYVVLSIAQISLRGYKNFTPWLVVAE